MTYHEQKAAMNGAEAIAVRFELVSPLARESMGEVHRGRDLQTGDTVAVKLIWRRRTRAQAPLPGHQRPAGSCPLVPVLAPVRVRASQTTARP